MAVAQEHALVARVVEQLALDVAHVEQVDVLRRLVHVDELGGDQVLDGPRGGHRREAPDGVLVLVLDLRRGAKAGPGGAADPARQRALELLRHLGDLLDREALRERAQHREVLQDEEVGVGQERAGVAGRAHEAVIAVGERVDDLTRLAQAREAPLEDLRAVPLGELARDPRVEGDAAVEAHAPQDPREQHRHRLSLERIGQARHRVAGRVQARVGAEPTEHLVLVQPQCAAQVRVGRGARGRQVAHAAQQRLPEVGDHARGRQGADLRVRRDEPGRHGLEGARRRGRQAHQAQAGAQPLLGRAAISQLACHLR